MLMPVTIDLHGIWRVWKEIRGCRLVRSGLSSDFRKFELSASAPARQPRPPIALKFLGTSMSLQKLQTAELEIRSLGNHRRPIRLFNLAVD